MTDEQIIENVLTTFAESEPADPSDPLSWHFTDADMRALIKQAVEMAREEEAA